MKKFFYYFLIFIILVIGFNYFKFDIDTKDLSDNFDSKLINVNSYSDSNYNKVLVYKNIYSYPIIIKKSDIILECNGSGENKDFDEKMVKNNMKIKVNFSNGNDSLKVNSGEVTNIYINEEYLGDSLPNHSVTCNYNVKFNLSGV